MYQLDSFDDGDCDGGDCGEGDCDGGGGDCDCDCDGGVTERLATCATTSRLSTDSTRLN